MLLLTDIVVIVTATISIVFIILLIVKNHSLKSILSILVKPFRNHCMSKCVCVCVCLFECLCEEEEEEEEEGLLVKL